MIMQVYGGYGEYASLWKTLPWLHAIENAITEEDQEMMRNTVPFVPRGHQRVSAQEVERVSAFDAMEHLSSQQGASIKLEDKDVTKQVLSGYELHFTKSGRGVVAYKTPLGQSDEVGLVKGYMSFGTRLGEEHLLAQILEHVKDDRLDIVKEFISRQSKT
jgi:hypothetical protein